MTDGGRVNVALEPSVSDLFSLAGIEKDTVSKSMIAY